MGWVVNSSTSNTLISLTNKGIRCSPYVSIEIDGLPIESDDVHPTLDGLIESAKVYAQALADKIEIIIKQ